MTPATTLAQDTTGVGAVAGVVRDADDRPVTDVAVCLVAIGRCAVTGPDGRFRIDGVVPGRWLIAKAVVDLGPRDRLWAVNV